MDTAVVKAYAKINPFLEITGRMPNGYHELDSVMMSVSIFDTVTLRLKKNGISLVADVDFIPTDRKNIAYRAAELFIEQTGCDIGVDIDIKKRIPAQAGMGGGSADGAAVLVGLNELCGRPLSTDSLCELGAAIGADLPFCIRGGCIRVGGIGDVVREQLGLPSAFFLVAKTDEGISTPAAYSAIDEISRGGVLRSPDALLEAIRQGSADIGKVLYNVFELPLARLAPKTSELRENMAHLSDGALLCGSGTAVFAVFDSEKRASDAAEILKKDKSVTFVSVCHPVGVGVEVSLCDSNNCP